jgi:hypothetical protein
MIRPRPNPELTDARLHRVQAQTVVSGHIWLRQLTAMKRAENLDRNTEPKARYHNRPRTIHDMNRRN